MDVDIPKAAKEVASDLDAGNKKQAFDKMQSVIQQLGTQYPNRSDAAAARREFVKTIDKYEKKGTGADLVITEDARGNVRYQVKDATPAVAAPRKDVPPPDPKTVIAGLPAPDTPAPVDFLKPPAKKTPTAPDPIDVATGTAPPSGFRFNPGQPPVALRPPEKAQPGRRTPEMPGGDIDVAAAAGNQPGKPGAGGAPYDPLKKVGGSPGNDDVATGVKLAGLGIGFGLNHFNYKDELSEQFKFREPRFAQSNLVGASTIQDYTVAARRAYNFLDAEQEAAKLKHNALPGGHPQRADLRASFDMIKEAKIKVSVPHVLAGENPVMPVAFDDVKAHLHTRPKVGTLAAFETAQKRLIDERGTALKLLEKEEMAAFQKKMQPLKLENARNITALLGAGVTNYGIDKLTPRNDKSLITLGVDLFSPAVMAARWTPLGKFAPVAKFGTIVTSHTVSHLIFDQQHDDLKK